MRLNHGKRDVINREISDAHASEKEREAYSSGTKGECVRPLIAISQRITESVLTPICKKTVTLEDDYNSRRLATRRVCTEILSIVRRTRENCRTIRRVYIANGILHALKEIRSVLHSREKFESVAERREWR